MVGMLTTGIGTLIPVPMTAEEEEAQIKKTLQRSLVERELQRRGLEASTKWKEEKNAARARGEGTFMQARATSDWGVGASRTEVMPTAPPV